MMIVVMGVSGCGKSTVGKALAEALGWLFFDADAYHPDSNVQKMAAGIPLTDEDRWPWLETLRDLLATQDQEGRSVVLACSALKQMYRTLLASRVREIRWVHLHGTPDEVRVLLERRHGHFMKSDLLASQFAILELPKSACTIPVLLKPAEQVRQIRVSLSI